MMKFLSGLLMGGTVGVIIMALFIISKETDNLYGADLNVNQDTETQQDS